MIKHVNQRLLNTTIQKSFKNHFTLYQAFKNQYSSDSNPNEPSQLELIHKKFSQLDIRIGQVMKVSLHPNNDQQYVSQVKVSEESDPITVVSGLVPFLASNELEGQLVTLMMNLKSTKFRGILSEAMILCGTNGSSDINQVKLKLLQPTSTIDTNTRVQLKSLPPLLEPLPSIKKKNYEAEFANCFTTDSFGNGLFQNHQLIVFNSENTSNPIPLNAQDISNGIVH